MSERGSGSWVVIDQRQPWPHPLVGAIDRLVLPFRWPVSVGEGRFGELDRMFET